MNIYVYKSHNIRKKASKKLSFNYKAQKMLNIGFKWVYPPPPPSGSTTKTKYRSLMSVNAE